MNQGKSLRGFLRFAQFVFVLAALFFVFDRFFGEYIPEFLQGSIFFEYVFFWGGAAVVAMVLCYLITISQEHKIKEIGDKIQSHKTDSRYMFR
jgi:hypothetical protein